MDLEERLDTYDDSLQYRDNSLWVEAKAPAPWRHAKNGSVLIILGASWLAALDMLKSLASVHSSRDLHSDRSDPM